MHCDLCLMEYLHLPFGIWTTEIAFIPQQAKKFLKNLLKEILFPFARYEVSFVKEEKINADIIHVLWNHNTNAI